MKANLLRRIRNGKASDDVDNGNMNELSPKALERQDNMEGEPRNKIDFDQMWFMKKAAESA